MAKTFLNSFSVEGILMKAALLASEPLSLAWGFKQELTILNQALSVIQNISRDAAEQQKQRSEAVEMWAAKLKDRAHDADDVLDEISYEFLRYQQEIQNKMKKKVLNFFSLSKPVIFRTQMTHKIKKITAALAALGREASAIGLLFKTMDATPEGITGDVTETSSFFADKDEIILGREKAVSDIITVLTSNSIINQENPSVLPIVGMPGIGKTTLAKAIYNEDEITRHFDEKIWMSVSNAAFDVNLILSQILEFVNSGVALAEVQSQEEMVKTLQEQLREKRCLLILDEVWNEDSKQWSNLMRCLSQVSFAQGSAMIVTTCSAKVGTIVGTLPHCHLEIPPEDECWSIFKNRAFPDSSASINPRLEKIGRTIAKKCLGVQLMAKVLGSILRSEDSETEWFSILENRIWDLPEEKERIMLWLALSFNRLKSPFLKQCFTYCSMLKKNSEIERDNLMQLWMAQGFLCPFPESNVMEMEDIGHQYFNILLESSLFQDLTEAEFGIVAKCKMHNLVHDLAQDISKSESLTQGSNEMDERLTIRHAAYISTSVLQIMLDRSVGGLRSLFLDGEVPSSMLPRFSALHVLNLYKADIEELPMSIGQLKQLRYLNVSRTKIKELPKSIGKLQYLQTLRMQRCGNLKVLPEEVQDLVNLRHIYFDVVQKTRHLNFGWHREFPVRIAKLTNLRTIPYFIAGHDKFSRGIKELGSLNKLQGELTIYDLEHVKNCEEGKTANLDGKVNIRKLTLVWGEEKRPTNRNEEDVLEGLQPHPGLEILEIHNFLGAKLSSWLPLKNLKKIRLFQCDECKEIPVLGHLPNLMHLEFDTMSNLKCLSAEIYGYNNVVVMKSSEETKALFPAMKTLRVCTILNLNEWEKAPVMAAEQIVVFPCLEELALLECPRLRNVPNHFSSIRQLEISMCHELSNLLSLLESCTSLQNLEISSCDNITSISMHGLTSVRKLVVSSCGGLTSMDFQSVPELYFPLCLEELAVSFCRSLESFPTLHRCTSLHKLTILDCDGLKGFAGSGQDTLPPLEELTIRNCPSLDFSPITQGMTSLHKLVIDGCPKMKIYSCPNLRCIPVSPSLRELVVEDCADLSSILGGLEYLEELSIANCPMLTTISPIDSLTLCKLVITSCAGIPELSITSSALDEFSLHRCTSICSLHIKYCQNLRHFSLQTLDFLGELAVIDCSILEDIPRLDSLTLLRDLQIWSCSGLTSLPSGLSSCTSLTSLSIEACHNLISLADVDVSSLQSLSHLTIMNCGKLQYLPTGIHSLDHLKFMTIGKFWKELPNFPDFKVPPQVTMLHISGWPTLKSLPQQIQYSTTCHRLCIEDFSGLRTIPDWFGNLASLTSLTIESCENLMYLPTVKSVHHLTKLRRLVIRYCPLLAKRCARGSGPEWPKISHIPDIQVGEWSRIAG